MKAYFITLLAAFFVITVCAQNSDRIFKPFKVDVSMGLAVPSGSGTNLGFSFAVEPKYAVLEQLALGLRMEGMAAVRNFNMDTYNNNSNGDVTTSSSYIATGDYYFSNLVFRPFVGGGLGLYNSGKASYKDENNNYYDYEVPSSTKFGGMIRAGFEVLHFRLGAEYNFVGNTDYMSPYTNEKLKNSYFSLKVGVLIGGGKYR